jgi:trehalose-phosphatase
MQALDPHLDIDRFFHGLGRARERVLLLDYDGTLAPFHKRPERAQPYPRVVEVLKEVSRRCATRIVIVSGRRLADLRGPLARIPHSEAWASHGWECFTASGARLGYEPARHAQRQLQLAEAPARSLAMHGARVERKIGSVAVHWRGMEEGAAQRVRGLLAEAWRGLAMDELTRVEFDGGVELCARGRDKGDAVRDILATCSPDAVCAYLGDDPTDEDAFEAIRSRGLGVLVHTELRDTRAGLWIAPPMELIAFLERWCDCGAPG